jgi:Zn-finger nucleic acid-binding protein
MILHQRHAMKIPVCTDNALVMSDHQGVVIDDSRQCRGVWPDRGELDKLIERSAAMMPAPATIAATPSQPRFANSDDENGRGQQGSRKESWLSNHFD